jgi:ribonucleoside-diphosphate reductase beta chain
MTTVFNLNAKYHTQAAMFLDGNMGIQRYETLKYKQLERITDKQLGFFWRPE